MISAGFFSGLDAQSEIDDLVDMLYGSYGERLVVTYKQAKEGLEKSWTEWGSNSPGSFYAF